MKKAVIYARYSSESQTDQSIDGQVHVCQDFAKRNDIEIVGEYIDRAMTGTNDNRPEFLRMIKDSAKQKWEVVLVYKLDRFSRNKYETAIHEYTLQKNGVKIVSAMENIPDTPEGIILKGVIESMNQYYSMELSQKVKRGLKESRLKGNFTGGYLVYGYKVNENKKIEINEEEAQFVRLIFEKISLGRFVDDVIAELNKKGNFYRGKRFARNTVYKMLDNTKYIGEYEHDGEVFPNMYPAIISKDLFLKVKQNKAYNKAGRKNQIDRYLLRNKLYCGYCGSIMKGAGGTSKTGKVYHYYKCCDSTHEACNHRTIPHDELDQLVARIIRKELSMFSIKRKLVDVILDLQEDMFANESVLSMLQKQRKECKNRVNNLMISIEKGLDDERTILRIKDLEKEIKDLDEKINREIANRPHKFTEKEIMEYLNKALANTTESLINVLIDKVVIYRDNIQIYFNNPISDNDYEYDLPNPNEKVLLSARKRDLETNEIDVGLYI